MSVREAHFVVWGTKIPTLDYEDNEAFFDKYEASTYKPKDLNSYDGCVSIVSHGMDDEWYVAGHVLRMADGYNGEGIVFASLPEVPQEAKEWRDAVAEMMGELGIEWTGEEKFGWHVFTQYR